MTEPVCLHPSWHVDYNPLRYRCIACGVVWRGDWRPPPDPATTATTAVLTGREARKLAGWTLAAIDRKDPRGSGWTTDVCAYLRDRVAADLATLTRHNPAGHLCLHADALTWRATCPDAVHASDGLRATAALIGAS